MRNNNSFILIFFKNEIIISFKMLYVHEIMNLTSLIALLSLAYKGDGVVMVKLSSLRSGEAKYIRSM